MIDKKAYCILDIETDITGNPTDFGFYSLEEGFIYFDNIKLAVDYLLKSEFLTFYAHAGMRFDYAVIYAEVLSRTPCINVAMSGSQGVFMSVKIGKVTKFLLDSYRLLPASLASLSKQFGGKEKLNLQGKMPWELSVKDRIDYLQIDCESLYSVINGFWSSIDQAFGFDRNNKPFRAKTLASLSLKIFVNGLKKGRLVNPDEKQCSMEEKSYFGGLVYVNTELSVLHDVTVFDVNSMYPFIMSKSRFPYAYHRSKVDKFVKGKVALWHCDYEIYDDGIPFIFDVESRQLSRTGSCIVDSETYLYVKKIGGQINVKFGYVYERCDFIFKDYILKCYQYRVDYGKDSPMGYTAKILMNSLYGKFGEKSIKRILSSVKPDKNEGVKIYSTNGTVSVELFDYMDYAFVQHRFPVIASLVTLRSRLYLKQLADINNVVYCDTDCLHIVGDVKGLDVGSKLGQLKEEFKGQAMYKAKKSYQLYKDGEIYKTVLKGIPASSRSHLDFRDLVGSEIVVDFSSYSSILDVVKQPDKPFTRLAKHRTVRDVNSRIE